MLKDLLDEKTRVSRGVDWGYSLDKVAKSTPIWFVTYALPENFSVSSIPTGRVSIEDQFKSKVECERSVQMHPSWHPAIFLELVSARELSRHDEQTITENVFLTSRTHCKRVDLSNGTFSASDFEAAPSLQLFSVQTHR